MVRRFAPLVGLAMLVAPPARASDEYPRTLERALDMPCAPACTLCHTTPSGGTLTANTPVGISMRRNGLECCDTGQLLDVVATLEANGVDSDMDGTPDVDELGAGTNPNAAEGELECLPPEPPDEGCAVSSSPRSDESARSWLLGPLVALVMVVRRRARSTRTHCQ